MPAIARFCFARGQRDDRGAFGDLLEQRRGPLAACPLQKAAADDHRVDVGLDDKGVAERLGDDHEFDWAAADSANLFGQGGAEDSEFVGERPPDLGLPAGTGLGRGTTLLEVVAGRQELRQPVAKQFLFLAQVEVHQSPNAALARMLR